MDEYSIRVAPDVLMSASEEILTKTNRLKSAFSNMRSMMRNSFGAWTGDAADLHRSLLEEQISAMEAITARFQEQATKLAQIAGNYAGSSQSVQSIVGELPTDLIV